MNQRTNTLLILASVAVAAGTVEVLADVPRTMTYQGRLVGFGSDAVTLDVALWDGPSVGSTQLFLETHATVLSNGVFSIAIGSETPNGVPDSALDAPELWLGVSVNAGAELTPRTRIGMVPFSAKSRASEELVVPGSFQQAVGVGADGRVGIGTLDPGAQLEVVGAIRASRAGGTQYLEMTSAGASGLFLTARTGENNKKLLFIQNVHDGGGSPAGNSDIIFRTGDESAPSAEIMRLRENGNVGIGTTTPSERLSVNGNVAVVGSVNHGGAVNFTGADVGTIASIDGRELIDRMTRRGGVRIGADDTLVIGDGESSRAVAANVDMAREETYISSDNSVHILTNLQGGWAARETVIFRDDGCVGIGTNSPTCSFPGEFGSVPIRLHVVQRAANSFAAHFDGNVSVNGTIIKAGGNFRIDHPMDPANKYLHHAFVESPDMKNIYDGVAILNMRGAVVVELPGYFESLNKDFRYQLTAIGSAAPRLHIEQEIEEGRFTIAGGLPNMKVSWQVTGTRKDPYAEKYHLDVEQEKLPSERGRYLHPELYGKPKHLKIGWSDAHVRAAPSAPAE